MRKWIAIGLWIALAAPAAWGQVYFGKNKIQYTRFDWQVLTTEHFQIYFYPEEKWLAEVAAFACESAYDDLRVKFNHHIYSRVPVIIYSAANYFSQTNVTPSLLPEAVGGFTEFFKGRVVVPFTGSYSDFVRIMRHELVHVFTLSKLDFVVRTHNQLEMAPPPLWFIEGLAEHWSRAWDAEADMILRQMVLEDRLVGTEDMERIEGTFYMYKVGQSILDYWSGRFGDAALTSLLENWWQGKSFDRIVRQTFGISLKELDRDWRYQLKKQYYPLFEHLDLPAARAEPVSPPGFFLAPTPVCVPAGDTCDDEIVYLGNQLGYSALYRQSLGGPGGADPIVKGGRSGRFELLHLFRSGIDASPSGTVVFSSKSNERDLLYFYDLARGRVTDQREFAELVSIVSPAFAPDGSHVVFAGSGKDGALDLYLLDIRSQDPPARLTHDLYRESDPVFSPDGAALIFASDRGPHGKTGALNLFRLDLATSVIQPVTDTTGINTSPEFLGPDTLLFVSDRAGSHDIYALVGGDSLFRVTALSSGAFDPHYDRHSERLYFAAHTQFGYRIYGMDLRTADWQPVPREAVRDGAVPWDVDRLAGVQGPTGETVERYRHDFSIDIAQSVVSYDAVFGTIGGFQMALSDVLGDEVYYFLLSNPANTTSEFLSSFNVAVTYLNRRQRLNYGWGAYHLFSDDFDEVEGLLEERQAGVVGFVSYPLSKFRRVELTNYLRYSKREELTPPASREGALSTSTLSLIYDNSLWSFTGPIDGVRANVTGGVTYDFASGRVLNRLLLADLRHYYRLGAQSAFATRLYAFLSGGEEPVRRFFGGSWDFRGFNRRAFYVRKILFASNELRFPLINRLAIDSPIGRLNFSGIKGALFADVGSAWDRGEADWRASWGLGWRVALGYLVTLRFDFAQTTDFRNTSRGLDFDFFFGWDF
jgi:hypothetical protein